ncbi:MAG: flagellar biosynthetic protein FliR [candidate division WS1 bacterium]|jgi:flagellar biosynthetic protein FliR|nr:flagellar biosynthetic protein FliR [candidate division WS1 bacterium]
MADALLPDFTTWLLAMVRVVAMLAFAPAFSAQTVPVTVRLYLAVAIGAVMGAQILPAPPPQFATVGLYMPAILRELAFGAIIGFGVGLLFEAVRFAGDVLDVQVGLAQATALDPTTQNQAAIISRASYFVALVLFLQLDGHHWLLAGLHRSFELIPLGAPVMAAVFLTDLAFGFIARVVPQMNVFLVGIPAKLMVGLGGAEYFGSPAGIYCGTATRGYARAHERTGAADGGRVESL